MAVYIAVYRRSLGFNTIVGEASGAALPGSPVTSQIGSYAEDAQSLQRVPCTFA